VERTYEYAYEGITLGTLFKIASFSFRIATDLSLHITKRVLHKIEKACACEPKQRQRYYDAIHDDD